MLRNLSIEKMDDLTLSLSVTHTHTLPLSLFVSPLSFALTHTYTHSHTHTLSLSQTLTHTQILTLPLKLDVSPEKIGRYLPIFITDLRMLFQNVEFSRNYKVIYKRKTKYNV